MGKYCYDLFQYWYFLSKLVHLSGITYIVNLESLVFIYIFYQAQH